MNAALERGAERCRRLDTEVLWHFERFLALARYNAGGSAHASRVLKALHDRARQSGISGTELFCAYDEALLFGGSTAPNPTLLATFAPADNDRPNLWSMKLRALSASGHAAQARAALHRIPASRLAALPCDRDYLGTLGALARAAIDLNELEYVEAIYALLAPYPEQFAVNVTFLCEGSVSQLLGMLARMLGREAQASEHLRAGIAISRQAGIQTAAEESTILANLIQ
jgi:hypothetical protein